MIALLIAAFVGFVSQAIFALAGIVTRQKMINLVNPCVPVEQRYKSTGSHPGNPSVSLTAAYRRLFPDGPLAREYRWRAALLLVSFFSWVACLALYGHLTGRH